MKTEIKENNLTMPLKKLEGGYLGHIKGAFGLQIKIILNV